MKRNTGRTTAASGLSRQRSADCRLPLGERGLLYASMVLLSKESGKSQQIRGDFYSFYIFYNFEITQDATFPLSYTNVQNSLDFIESVVDLSNCAGLV